jgi:hypothetical protein
MTASMTVARLSGKALVAQIPAKIVAQGLRLV